VKIGGRLLRDQNSFGGPEHRPQQPGEILPVRGCGAEYFPLARSLSGTPEGVAAALRREATHVGVPDLIDLAYGHGLVQLLLDGVGGGPTYYLDLPVDRNVTNRALSHRGRAGVDEDAKNGQ